MSKVVSWIDDPNANTLALRIRTHLIGLAMKAQSVTYAMLADTINVQPPNRIHQVTKALEALMAEDAANGHPFISALVISARRRGLPAPGFFETAHALGRFAGPADGSEVTAFHHKAFADAVAFWGSAELSGAHLDRARSADHRRRTEPFDGPNGT